MIDLTDVRILVGPDAIRRINDGVIAEKCESEVEDVVMWFPDGLWAFDSEGGKRKICGPVEPVRVQDWTSLVFCCVTLAVIGLLWWLA